ncbi:MAG: CopG family ribbon-helix-helix protein [Chloroflexota bacterium]
MATATITIQLPVEVTGQYDALARAMGRTRDSLIDEALHEYLARQAEDLARIEHAIAQADRGEFATDEEMEKLFTEFGGPPEKRAALRQEMRASLDAAYGTPACE